MAKTPILEIPVDSSGFERFAELFNDYRTKLDEMPEQWERLNEAMDGASEGGEALAAGALTAKDAIALASAQAVLIAEALHDATKEQHALGDATKKSDKNMGSLAKTAQGLGKTIVGIGSWVLKMSAIGLGIGALGSGLGLDALAGAALSRQRAANQLGLTPGQLASFQINAQQFLGVGALQAAAGAQIDVTKAGYLAALGISFQQAQGSSTSDLAFDELKAARAAYLEARKTGTPAAQTPAVQAYLALGGSMGDIRNAAAATLSDLIAAQKATQEDAGQYQLDRKTTAEFIELKKAFDAAGLSIETSLINALGKAHLPEELARLSKEVVGLIDSFVNSKELGIVLADVKGGLKGLEELLVTTDWKAVGADIKQLGSELVGALQFLHLIPGPHDDGKKASLKDTAVRVASGAAGALVGAGVGGAVGATAGGALGTAVLPGIGTAVGAAVGGLLGRVTGALVGGWTGSHALDIAHGLGAAWDWTKQAGTTAAAAIAGSAQTVARTASALGVDPLLALADATYESGLNPRAQGDQNSSFGLFQLHRGGELGALSRNQAFNPTTNAATALAEFARVKKERVLSRNQLAALGLGINRKVTPDELTPGQLAALAQRPADPIGYAKAVDALYRKEVEALKLSHEQAHQTVFGTHRPAEHAASAHARAQDHVSATVAHHLNRAMKAMRERTAAAKVSLTITNSTSARIANSANALVAT